MERSISLPKKPLLGLTLNQLKQVATSSSLPAFVGKQMANWIYQKHVRSIDEMTNISLVGRERLKEEYEIGCSAPVDLQHSVDGTVKYLYRTTKGDYIETVYIPDRDRATLCVSSQVGCKMRCAFCMTGRQGYVASLSVTDILNQIYSLPDRETLTNVVFMGQGEPLDNLDAVLQATEILTAPWAYAWSPKRITVSSVGLAKGLGRFLEESRCHLAISLHHPLPEGRAELMPAEKAFSIVNLVRLLRQYDFCKKDSATRAAGEGSHQRRLSFEYIVFQGINDSPRHLDALIRLVSELDCRINLIRFHDIPDTPLKGVSQERMLEIRDYLTSRGLFATVRASRGQDIFAACGLLSTAKQEAEKSK